MSAKALEKDEGTPPEVQAVRDHRDSEAVLVHPTPTPMAEDGESDRDNQQLMALGVSAVAASEVERAVLQNAMLVQGHYRVRHSVCLSKNVCKNVM